MAPTPDLLIVTSSALVGTRLFDQLLASPQLRVPALPVQETAEGARRSSSCSSHSGALVRRRFLADPALERFRASTHCLIHRRQARRGIVGDSSGCTRLGVGCDNAPSDSHTRFVPAVLRSWGDPLTIPLIISHSFLTMEENAGVEGAAGVDSTHVAEICFPPRIQSVIVAGSAPAVRLAVLVGRILTTVSRKARVFWFREVSRFLRSTARRD